MTKKSTEPTNASKRCNRRSQLQKVCMKRNLHSNQINLKYTNLANEIHTGDETDNQLEVNSSNISFESLCDIHLLKAESSDKYILPDSYLRNQ